MVRTQKPDAPHFIGAGRTCLRISLSCHAAFRLDGARPLDIAGHDGQARVGWTLLCHGAQAVPMWELEGARSSLPHVRPTTHSMMPRMLVCNAVQCEDPPW